MTKTTIVLLIRIEDASPLFDIRKLDNKRISIGLMALIILFMIQIPVPHSFFESWD
ncbi:MAG: hypothetical protein KGZ85_03465 [Ignavibacterium sp.]|nr:hypothetical protein [Ignavibacterium sp.]